MSDILQLLIQSNTINFLIVLFIVIFLIKKLNVSKKIENVRDEITKYVDSSVTEKEHAEQELTRINDKISKLPAVVERIKKSTDNNIKNMEKNLQQNIEIKKQDISNNSKRLFTLETKKFKSRLTNLLSEKSIELSRENAIKHLKENPELHKRYIDRAIEELDKINL